MKTKVVFHILLLIVVYVVLYLFAILSANYFPQSFLLGYDTRRLFIMFAVISILFIVTQIRFWPLRVAVFLIYLVASILVLKLSGVLVYKSDCGYHQTVLEGPAIGWSDIECRCVGRIDKKMYQSGDAYNSETEYCTGLQLNQYFQE